MGTIQLTHLLSIALRCAPMGVAVGAECGTGQLRPLRWAGRTFSVNCGRARRAKAVRPDRSGACGHFRRCRMGGAWRLSGVWGRRRSNRDERFPPRPYPRAGRQAGRSPSRIEGRYRARVSPLSCGREMYVTPDSPRFKRQTGDPSIQR